MASPSRSRSRLPPTLLAGGLLSLLLAANAFGALGGLTQKPGTAGCFSFNGTGGACGVFAQIDGARSIATSPDGANVYVAALQSDAVVVFDRDTTTGALAPKAGTGACISNTGNAGACFDGVALDGTSSVTISPDGKNVYATALNSDAVAIFDRNATTGALTQQSAGCISDTGAGPCVDGTGLDGAISATVSSDGANVYVASQAGDAITIFDRDQTTGALTQKPGTSGCVTETGAGPCQDGVALDNPTTVVGSPNGTSIYVASSNSGAVSIFDRTANTGALTQKAGTAGCISETGTAGACTDGEALISAIGMTISPDGENVYVASSISEAVAIFDRSAATGALTQKAGTAGCVSETGTAGACVDGTAMGTAFSVTVSPGGESVYATSQSSDAVTIFDRDATSGALTQQPGSAGCISDDGTGGACVDGAALNGPGAVGVSPDGENVYVAAATSAAIAIFDREGPPVVDPPPDPGPDPGPGPDTSAPETTITKKPKGKLKTKGKSAKAAISFVSEPGATFQCRLDGAQFKTCLSPFTVKAKSKAGKGRKHAIEVRATDAAGNVETSPARAAFKVIRQR